MGLFDFLAPDGLSGAQRAKQTRLAKKAQNTLEEGQEGAIGAINTGTQQAVPSYERAAGLFDPIIADRSRATDMYYNSLGLNGAEGYDEALNAYQQSPGYQFALQQANQNVTRNAANLGSLRSGNTMMALSDRAQQLQNLDFNNWQNQLKGLDVLEPSVYGAGALQKLGGLFTNQGQDIANVYAQFAQPMANQYNNRASLIGQQAMIDAQQQQQGIANAIGLGGLFTGMLGKGGAFGQGGVWGA